MQTRVLRCLRRLWHFSIENVNFQSVRRRHFAEKAWFFRSLGALVRLRGQQGVYLFHQTRALYADVVGQHALDGFGQIRRLQALATAEANAFFKGNSL